MTTGEKDKLDKSEKTLHYFEPEIYRCGICGKGFFRPIALIGHERTHIKEVKYGGQRR